MTTYYKAINWNEIEDVIDKINLGKVDRTILAWYAYSAVKTTSMIGASFLTKKRLVGKVLAD